MVLTVEFSCGIISLIATAINITNRQQLKKFLKKMLTTGKQSSSIVEVVSCEKQTATKLNLNFENKIAPARIRLNHFGDHNQHMDLSKQQIEQKLSHKHF